MGKILETTYHDTVEKVTSFYGSLIDNSFYNLNDRKPTIVTYYNIDRDYSSLDPGAKIAYDNIGDKTPLRFNRIKDFIIYGFNRIELQTSIEEFGYEADRISGECFVIPNTIKPIEGDYFEVEHITDSTWLFIITDVQQDTLNNAANVYKLSYKLEYVDHDRLMKALIGKYKMIEVREGTDITRIVREEDYDIAKQLDTVAVMLKNYYNDLFYNPRVQTFTFMDLNEWRIYDPYMIEFLIRNEILADGGDSYIYVHHQLYTNKTFSMDYDRTIFKAFETRDLSRLRKSQRVISLREIKSYGTTFASRYEPYFEARYIDPPDGFSGVCLIDEIFYRIIEQELFDDIDKDKPIWVNILVKHFSKNQDDYITEEELQSLVDHKYDVSKNAFYYIPLLILCLETAIKNALN